MLEELEVVAVAAVVVALSLQLGLANAYSSSVPIRLYDFERAPICATPFEVLFGPHSQNLRVVDLKFVNSS